MDDLTIIFQETQWLSELDSFTVLDFKALDPHLQRLDRHLLLRSFIVGYSLSVVDVALWGAIRGNRVAVAAVKKGSLVNLTRWYTFFEGLCLWAPPVYDALNASARAKVAAASKQGASYNIGLENTENGVVTRFPPEPS